MSILMLELWTLDYIFFFFFYFLFTFFLFLFLFYLELGFNKILWSQLSQKCHMITWSQEKKVEGFKKNNIIQYI